MAKDIKGSDISKMVLGNVSLPHSKELEEQVLGSMLVDNSCVNKVQSILKEEDFYLEKNRIIYNAICEVYKNNPVDIVLVCECIIKNNYINEVDGVYGVSLLTNNVTSTANIEAYCTLIKQKSIQRRLIDFSSSILAKSADVTQDVFDLLSDSENKLRGINYELSELKITPLSTIAMNVITKFDQRVYNAKNNIEDLNSIYTNFKEWDEINGELFNGLYVIAGRPAMGKGVHLTECICRMSKKTRIGVINGEMTDEQLLKRIGCNLLGFDNFLYKKNPKYITEEEQQLVHDAMQEAINLDFRIYNNRYINKISTKIKNWVENDGVKCVFVDFLTLLKLPKELERVYNTATARVDYILDVLTSLCKDLKVPIILYVQMNREILGKGRSNHEPNLADLKQSGSIEELAYQVSFLHRPEYYDENSITDELGESTKGLMYQIIAKHRDGINGRLKFRAELGKSKLIEWYEPFEELKGFQINGNIF